jgi:hypothetical protein
MPASESDVMRSRARFHLRVGWYALLAFLTLGVVLEGFHGLKLQWYLEVANHTRRLMWTLGHAHGTLLAVINIAFAVSLGFMSGWPEGRARLASRCLVAATILLPGGFLLGGAILYDGDPGLGVLLVPLGAALLFIGTLLTALGARHA